MPNTQIEIVNENQFCNTCEKETPHSVTYSVMKDASGRVVASVQQSKTCKACGKKS